MGNKTWNLQRALHQLKNFDHVLDVPGGHVLHVRNLPRGRVVEAMISNGNSCRAIECPLTIQGLRTAFKAMGSEDYSFEIRK